MKIRWSSRSSGVLGPNGFRPGRWRAVFPLVAMLLLLFCAPASAGPLRIGTVSSDPAQDMKEFQPLVSYLGRQLAARGVDSATLVVTRDIPQMAKLLQSGGVDIYIDSPFPVLMTQHLAGNQVVLRRWKRGVAAYAGVIFTRGDSGVTDLRQLGGKMLAFEEPFSTSSYFLPKAYLRQSGLKLSHKASAQEAVAGNETGYTFSDDDRNTLAWVLKGLVSAGAMNNEKFDKLTQGHQSSLRVLATTANVPRHLVTLRKDLAPELASAIVTTLTAMEDSPEGRATLKAFNDTTRFDALPQEARKTLDELRRTFDAQIREELSGRAP